MTKLGTKFFFAKKFKANITISSNDPADYEKLNRNNNFINKIYDCSYYSD